MNKSLSTIVGYLAIGIVVGTLAAYPFLSKNDSTTTPYTNTTNIGIKSGDQQYTQSNVPMVGADKLGASYIAPKEGDKNSAVQSGPTTVDQIIGDREIIVK